MVFTAVGAGSPSGPAPDVAFASPAIPAAPVRAAPIPVEALARGGEVMPLAAVDAAKQLTLERLLARAADDAAALQIEFVAMTVVDLRTGARWDLNGDVPLSFMSSAKFPWVAAAVAAAGVDEVAAFAPDVFESSSNDAAGSVINLAGGLDAINEYWYPAFGMPSTCTQDWYNGWYSGDCGLTELGSSAYSTSDDMVTFLSRLWAGALPGLGPDSVNQILAWASLSPDELDPYGDGTITGFMPRSTWSSVYHKVGWYFDPYLSAADVGIVDLPATSYALAIAIYGGPGSADQQLYMAALSCDLYRVLSGDMGWTCGRLPEADVA